MWFARRQSPTTLDLNRRYPAMNIYCFNCNVSLVGKSNTKYCSNKCQHLYQRQKRINEFEEKQIVWIGLKSYLIEQRGHMCEICHHSNWMNQPITLELDHVDGNSENNYKSNLRLLCPNCHSQTPTFKGKNRGKGRMSRYKKNGAVNGV